MAASGLVLKPSPLEDFKASASRHNLHHFGLEAKPIQVFVTMLGPESSMVPLEVSKSDTIASIKIQIQDRRGFYVDQQRLVYGGRELTQDERRLQDYGIRHGDVLHLVLRLSDLVCITVKTVNGDTFVYRVRSTGSVKDLKKQISGRQRELLLDQQLLTLRGEQLEDSVVIEDISLDGDAVLCLQVQKSSNFRSECIGRKIVELVVTASKILSQPEVASLEDVPSKFSVATSEFEPASSVRFSAVKAGKEDDQLQQVKFTQDPARHYSILEIAKNPIKYEVSQSLKDLVERVKMGLHAGQAPKLTPEGSGGVYFLKDECGLQNIAVFKPMDEEPMAVNNPRGFSSTYIGEGLKRGTRSGEGALREVAAYILDYPARGVRLRVKKDEEGFSGVPPTMMIKSYHEAFNYSPADRKLYMKPKAGSLQQYVHALSSCEDMGSSGFSVEEVHKITVLDLRLANADRNGGNILVCKGKDEVLKLIPIDHGYCLPEKFEECTFEWLYWPQASVPYGPSALEYIESLDAEQDIALLQQCGWRLRPQCAHVLRVSTMLLKKGAAAGLTPFQIGSIMSRGECLDKKAPIELLLEEAEAVRLTNARAGDLLKILSGLLDDCIIKLKSV